jgi:membrane fusion protein (multidrug efflux system)
MAQWKSKQMLIMLIAVGVLFGIVFGFKAFKNLMVKRYMAANRPVMTVSATKVTKLPWQHKISAAGSLRAIKGVDVTAEIAGLVSQIFFTPGATVEEGTELVQLNADSDIALLHSLEAQAELAEINYNRDKAQFAVQAVSKATVDTDLATLKSSRAQAAQQAAIVAKKTIRAPFTGRLGIRLIDLGQYINPGDKMVTLQALDPIFADFFVPQQELLRLTVGQTVTVNNDSFPGKTFTGKITTINPLVDVNTRNIQVQATLSNPELKLLPGMFVNVAVQTGDPMPYLTVPQSAISFNPYGEIVYLLKEKGKDTQGKPMLIANQVFVETGEARGDQVIVLKGLKEGDLVVTSGQLKLKNGMPVVINNKITPSNEPAPNPVDE